MLLCSCSCVGYSIVVKLARGFELCSALQRLSPTSGDPRAQALSLELLERVERDPILRDTSTKTYALWNQTLVN
jgi:hypothetical protein